MDTSKRAGPPKLLGLTKDQIREGAITADTLQKSSKKIARATGPNDLIFPVRDSQRIIIELELARMRRQERFRMWVGGILGFLFVILPAVCVAVRIWLGEQPS